MNLPNLLTMSRLAGIPILVWLLVARFGAHDQWAAALFLVFSATDTFDGHLARRLGRVTELGKFLDPLADKLFILAVLVTLVQEGMLPAWVVVVIFSRELLITILRSVGLGQGRVIAASNFGKTKTVTQVVAVLAVILARPYPALVPLTIVLVAVALLVTVGSGIDYLWKFRHVLGLPPRRPLIRPLPLAGGSPGSGQQVDPLVATLAVRLGQARRSLGVAESCTGGLLAGAITDLPGSSAFFSGGVVSYSNELKQSLLDVPATLLGEKGAVSAEVAVAMAQGARERLGTDYALSITGVAGPGGEGTAKPAGLTFIGLAGPDTVIVKQFNWAGDRWENRRLSVRAALRLLVDSLEEIGT
ncbi:MAG: CDP-diacylglycerol--glycerol-3-phosphate 3-phosphatidyltransferase [Candidatus Dormibacteraeota bacterium]|nr:CDP-diacylglycerol--glycerol-3-phosphate 3-phosphatidyltransferase [Candidatus Dormibacteraeota bacterium]